MKAKDIEPGELYALKPWHRPDAPIRAVRAIRAEGRSLVYEGPGGEEWTGALSRVIGLWQPHADAREAARRAVDQLVEALERRWSKERSFSSAYAVERGYRDFRVHLVCAIAEAERLAESITSPDSAEHEGGSGAVTPEPPVGSN